MIASATPAPNALARRAVSPQVALGILTIVYLLNFLDRTLIYILFPLMKTEMSLSDLELALLGSTSFVLFYTTLGLPFGWLADRVSRRKLIAFGLVTWSLFSGLTGYAWDFWSVFACRVMVGVGEATLGPAAMSLLSDLFPANKRGTVQSVYSAGIPLGAAAAFFGGSAIAAEWGWRAAFPVLGFPGLALAALMFVLPEPARGGAAAQQASPPADWRVAFRNRELHYHVFGYAMLAVAANSVSIWVPTWMVRAQGVPLTTVGLLAGVSLAVAGGLATAFGGSVADAWQKRAVGGRRRFGIAIALTCAPLWLALLYAPSTPVLFAAYFVLAGLGLAWLGPAAADVHDVVGPTLRGLGTAAYFLVVNLVGYGIGPLVVGGLSDQLGGKDDPAALGAALLVAPVACLLGAVLLHRGMKLAAARPTPTV